MRRFLLGSDFISHAPIGHGFEGAEDFPDFVMGPAVFLRVVEGQLPFAGSGVFFVHVETTLLQDFLRCYTPWRKGKDCGARD